MKEIQLGNQGRINNSDEVVLALRDYLDIVLLNKPQVVEPANQPDKIFLNNETFWEKAISNNLYPGQIIKLSNFDLLEWIPSSPGLFHTRYAYELRNEAMKSFYNREGILVKVIELKPYEKRGMVQGGYGSLRLAPKLINNDLIYFLCATSNGVSHEGITITLRKSLYEKIVEELKKGKIPVTNLIGRLMILPRELSPIQMRYYAEIPKYYLEIIELETIGFKSAKNALVSVAITYSKREDIMRHDSFSYSFCTFPPTTNNRDLRGAVSWLQDYAIKYSREKEPVIIGDFDEEFNHFGNVEFPIKEIGNGRIPMDKLVYFKELFHYQINELIMGDKNVFKNSQIGAVGSNATSSNNTFQQINYNVPEDLDFEKLNGQLGQLRESLAANAKTPEEF
ncbi:MAG: hypothetical protein KDK36_07540, partial [Leptospiraceae bacterium]|nr:hypothetical protein [Leptospiraceae bacterium]